MQPSRLALDLGAPPEVPEEAIAAAAALLRGGWLHRYGETLGDSSDAALLEEEFAAALGARYCVGVNSCGSAMFLALLGSGVRPGDRVLMNGFTLSPVPGAIAHAGAEPVIVEVTQDLVIDLDDLARQARASGARHLLLSHMRGHIADMDRLMTLCDELGMSVIEDCAHTMGARWAGRPTGRFGRAGCFSLQSYKHVNAGEGGLLVTDDEDLAARAILASGSYMLYGQHRARPSKEVFARWKDLTPNFSLRLSSLAAAVARPQLRLLAERARVWSDRHARLAALLGAIPGIRLPHRPQQEEHVQSSIQFAAPGLDPERFRRFLAGCRARGVFLKWFGAEAAEGYTSAPRHWRYLRDARTPPHTEAILATLCDMRIPLSLPAEACGSIAAIVAEELEAAQRP
ncbi:aminotransferase [Falsiroseomonas bella]|uniref:Aminotransferase n=1 Tax=Falsiroseomonas bella TaxID=2184016 RepID=A0A317F7R8_9PROT|nr:aminotransferase class I/II-fold pyridoxal phosphate-dependent enzyme [Falsiroseomonas bella]PWS34512.1 aminotransferase [Falsiroseomonas bella]